MDEANHLKWTSYVKFFDSNLNIIDIRKFIKKVRFSLHRDYDLGQHKDVFDRSAANRFEFTTQGYTQFSMLVTIHFQKETGLKFEVFRLPKFDHTGVKKRQ